MEPRAPKVDLFLSYRGSDLESVREVRRALEARGVQTFLDRENLHAGQPWPEELERTLEKAAAVAVFVGRGDLGSWQRREVWFALDRQVDAEKRGERFPVIPVLLPGARPEKSFLFGNTWVDLGGGLADPGAIEAIVSALRGREVAAPAEVPDLCPYRGLEPFRFEDSPFFFGRETFSRELLEKVLTHDLVAVVGPSGSGKSSVVQAGLLPELGRHPEGRTWETVTFRPGDRPFEELGYALQPLLEPGLGQRQILKEGKALGDDLRSGAIPLRKVVDRLLENSRGSRGLLLICDQFEELFRETPEEQRQPFVGTLLGALERSRLRLVLTLRADFYGHALNASRELGQRLAAGQVNLGPLTEEELERAIREPAERVGLTFEPGLVEAILRDLDGNPGALPLLEFCLQELYENREGRRLTHAGYLAVGRVDGAVAGRAERALAAFGDEERRSARRLFAGLVRLASPGEGGSDTKRRLRRKDLDVPWQLVERFVEARLLVTGREGPGEQSAEWVEIAHEALIGSWRQLRDWLDEDKQFLLWRQRVHHAVSATGAVLTGRALNEARRWLRERGRDLSESELELIRSGMRRRAAWIGLAALAALAVSAAALVIGWGALDAGRTAEADELGRRLDRREIEQDELVDMLLQPSWPLRSFDVAEALERKERLGGLLDHAWQQDEPRRLIEIVTAARPVLVRELTPYESLARALWMLDYLAATSEDEEVKPAAAKLGEELRDDLRRVYGPPESDPESFVRIDPSSATAAACGGEDGAFCMGSDAGDEDEQPQHPVRLDPYCLQVHEVTKLEYSRFDRGHSYEAEHETRPATNVSWYQAYAYAAWVGGRLPTEAEWEHAAKGGCPFASGYCKRDGQGVEEATLGELAWYGEKHPAPPHPVGEKNETNQHGLFDIYGNVWEWTADWYASEEYERRSLNPLPVENPWGSRTGDGPPELWKRVTRGGSFTDGEKALRPTERLAILPTVDSALFGFRVRLPASR